MMERHAPRFAERAGRYSRRIAGLDQRADREAQFAHAIRFEERAKEPRAAFAQHVSQTALREGGEYARRVETIFPANNDVRHARKRFFSRVRRRSSGHDEGPDWRFGEDGGRSVQA